jgi:hypothetical protein
LNSYRHTQQRLMSLLQSQASMARSSKISHKQI